VNTLKVNSGQLLAVMTRSGMVESQHYGHLVILSPDGSTLLDLGQSRAQMFPRSAIKSMQAVAMVRSGLNLEGRNLAIVCASHGGTDEHQEVALENLKSVGLDASALMNTPDKPIDESARKAWGDKTPTSLAANCSGKHSGMLATCVINGWDTKTYKRADHPLQIAIKKELEILAEEKIELTSIDGCGAPLFTMSTLGMARAARTMRISGYPVHTKIVDACIANPRMIFAEGAFDTRMMQKVPGLFVKGGAESVMVASLPDGHAITWKVLDGSKRVDGPIMVAALARCGITVSGESVEVMGGSEVLGEISAAF
jgi:L-asparaginase II